ncbi:MAG: GTP-binding protein [Candidatus Lokiarchaeota archaeon]|nr:GTP-binding protein [Candidatus Lokiarchaeota archaeon]
MTARTDIIVGIVFSRYDEIAGPDAIYWLPGELTRETLTVVSNRSLNMLSGDEHSIPKELEIVTFPPIELKGMIKFVQIDDRSKRGGFINASITLLFNDKDAPVFYKYRAEFDQPFEDFSRVVVALEQHSAFPRDYLEAFTRFSSRTNSIIKNLYEKEVGLKDMVEFPDPDEGAIKYRTYKFKVVVVGDPEVGKTSLILRYTDNAFRRTYITTIGVNVTAKNLIYSDRKVKFAIWDVAGQTKFQKSRRHFYEGAHGVIIVFDLTRPASFEDVGKWYDDVKQAVRCEIPGIILGNKADLASDIKVSSERIEATAQQLRLGYIETSASEGKNVNEAFLYLAAMLVNKGKEEPEDSCDA